uniref:Uncharacterized protein n=1 Tax=Alexandrium monilatum TaxID=311494 RepID=A0A7S4T2H7_9DINO
MTDEKKAEGQGAGLGKEGHFDKELYGGSKEGDFVHELPTDKEAAELERQEGGVLAGSGLKPGGGGKPQDDVPGGPGDDPFKDTRSKTIADREDEYRAQRHRRMLSPPRADPFADETPAPELQTYKDVMIGQQLDKEKQEVMRKIQKQKEEEATQKAEGRAEEVPAEKKKRRWDSTAGKKGEEEGKKEGKKEGKDKGEGHKKDEGDEGDKDEEEKKKKPKKKQERTCVDLPGVRLAQVDHSELDSFVKDKEVDSALKCTAECGRHISCKQSIFSHANKGCYLFKLSTVEVNAFKDGYNSSYCGDQKDESLMMMMLHQAYKGYVPAKPAPAPAGPVAGPPPDIHVRRLSDTSTKFYWQIAHVPNLTMGVMRDQGASAMRIIPRNGSCFTTPGFIYMVACMTAKPVYMSGRSLQLDPPPFNDRCLAVGGLCGATCGSGTEVDEHVARYCPRHGNLPMRRLSGEDPKKPVSPYASARIPKEMLVQPIEPRRSATTRSIAARCFFHGFMFFIAISYIATILGKFPGNFTDFFPVHTWEEIRTHGYVLDKFGSAVSTGVSASEGKTIVFRNWLGKIAARPRFDDPAIPTFAKWVDVFCDEGHREGARIMWMAWTDFLDTNPPVEFLQQWSVNVQNLTFEQAAYFTPFDLEWELKAGKRKVLPVTPEQGDSVIPGSRVTVPAGGVKLQPDSLAKLKDLYEVFKFLPDNLKMEPALSKMDDCVLTRKVALGFEDGRGKKPKSCFTVPFSNNWRSELEKTMEQRMDTLGLSSKEHYKSSLVVTDSSGKRADAFGRDALAERQFPLHCREPLARQDRQVVMVYCARAKPESDRKGIAKTRGLDKYLWACLRPKAVRRATGDQPRRSFKKKRTDERQPLLSQADRPWSSVSGPDFENFVLEEVSRSVEAVVKRQNEKFIHKKDGNARRRSANSTLAKDYAKAYLQHRTVDSDWEMARFCYGEIVGEEMDKDGDEVVVLDNPSPALLELVSDLQLPGMGLVALETEEVSRYFGLSRGQRRTAHTAKPTLEFLFTDTSGAEAPAEPSREFTQELRKKLQGVAGASDEEAKGLVIEVQLKGDNLVALVRGPGKIIEPIRDRNLSSVQVLSYLGRMIDSHPTVTVKKDLLMPYAGVRGKSGGLNYVVDLLQFRHGFIGTGAEGDPTPERMLFGIFDARHQPHPDYWRQVLPKFMHNTDSGYTYEANDEVTMVQAPQSFPAVDMNDDVLDVHNGLCFNLMNVIRNRCGGVTSCGTNAVWQINARDFSRQGENAESLEYFDSRTKIEDTASTHIQFCQGKRSVYVQEKISTGIAKLNNDYLCALERWAEGAVQLFWLQIFADKTHQLVLFGLAILGFLGAIYYSLYGGWTKDFIGMNVFCDVEGTPTLLLGQAHGFCNSLYGIFSKFLEHTIDRVIFKMAAEDYMRLIDFSLVWLLIVLSMAAITALLSARGIMPRIVRVFIMMENISYWLTSCSIFFWLSLTLFMIIGMNPPLMFNVTHFMMFILAINITNHCMINEYKNMGGCSELSIWRSQQAYTLAAPLYVMAIARGTAASWGIIWQRLDKSFWTASDHGSDVVRGVTVWVTFIWVAFVFCTFYLLILEGKRWLFNEIGDKIQKQCQVVAVLMLGLLAITVWEPFLALWGADKSISDMDKTEDKEEEEEGDNGKEGEGGGEGGKDAGKGGGRTMLHGVASLMVWWRSKAWIMRYVIDFGMPLLVLCGVLGGGVSILMMAAHASIVKGFRV